MNELALAALFQAIVQIESGGNLKARNGDAYGPAQIKPVVVEDLKRAGYDVSLRERGRSLPSRLRQNVKGIAPVLIQSRPGSENSLQPVPLLRMKTRD